MELIPKIQQKFNEVIAYSQNIEYPKTDKLFSKWYKNKEYFIKTFFNGELKYTYPEKVKFDINTDIKISKYAEFIDYVSSIMNHYLSHPFIDYLTSISAIDFFIFAAGISTVLCLELFAFLILVSISAIGSVVFNFFTSFSFYLLLFTNLLF